MWDQVQCYGYNRKEDGSIEVFHRGEHFFGPFPVRLLVQLHARYVIWATEKHINSPTFGSPDLEKQARTLTPAGALLVLVTAHMGWWWHQRHRRRRPRWP